jgi:hypothetical protein
MSRRRARKPTCSQDWLPHEGPNSTGERNRYDASGSEERKSRRIRRPDVAPRDIELNSRAFPITID